jgi:pimeloyl-ACP methyl ester carboxylesterase
MADFLLIHGAWHGGWCWDRVRPILEEAGHRVVAPTLSGLEQQRTETVEGIDLTTHVDDVVGAALDLESDDLILVGHSYAGFVVTGAADRLREEVTLYVYLDAGLPEWIPGALSHGRTRCPQSEGGNGSTRSPTSDSDRFSRLRLRRRSESSRTGTSNCSPSARDPCRPGPSPGP